MRVYTVLAHADKIPVRVLSTCDSRAKAQERMAEAQSEDEDNNRSGRSYDIVETELE